ncbi:pyridoxamine 5'-phosphate oxidase family protein [Rhizobium sp. 18065]|uniref:pyridoxamine 5'-phosphate oxidase family protein n=1 Tax=Rhizobium sp. 18065 TaxID=2681411 RepID=UPI00135C31BF|nr:pyridoxamine 5'-phosphate oxidase family protein [Rhizobium sp. 18065]
MSELTLHDLSKKMAKLDFAMLNTAAVGGGLTSRPMSNNGDVEYDGDSYFFAYTQSRKISEIRADNKVSLTYTGALGMLGGSPIFVGVEGSASLIEDKSAFADHWTKDLDRYFPEGIETPGVVMIKVHAKSIRYWDGSEEGQISL